MLKKIVSIITLMMLVFTPITASAGIFSHSYSYHSSRSFSGGLSHSYSSASGTYRSGWQSPSSRVTRSYSYGQTYGSRSFGSGIGSHLFSFGAGWLLGSMFHPFGGYWGGPWGYGYHGFSLFGILFDLLILYIIFRVVRGLFRR